MSMQTQVQTQGRNAIYAQAPGVQRGLTPTHQQGLQQGQQPLLQQNIAQPRPGFAGVRHTSPTAKAASQNFDNSAIHRERQNGTNNAFHVPSSSASLNPGSIGSSATCANASSHAVTAKEAFERIVSSLEEETQTPQKQTRALLVLLQKLQVDLDDQQRQHESAIEELRAYVDHRFVDMEKALEQGLRAANSTAMSINERATKFAQLGEALERSLGWVDASREKELQVQGRVDKLEQELELLRRSGGTARFGGAANLPSSNVPAPPAAMSKYDRLDQDVEALRRALVEDVNSRGGKAPDSSSTLRSWMEGATPNSRSSSLAPRTSSAQEIMSDKPLQDGRLGTNTLPDKLARTLNLPATTGDLLSRFGHGQATASPPEAPGDFLSRLRTTQGGGTSAQSGASLAEVSDVSSASKIIRDATTALSSRLRPSSASASGVGSNMSGPSATSTASTATRVAPAQSELRSTQSLPTQPLAKPSDAFFYKTNKGTTH